MIFILFNLVLISHYVDTSQKNDKENDDRKKKRQQKENKSEG